jgi:hypothetical protein
MPIQIIGPLIAIGVNVPLAVWALLQDPRRAANRAFAFLGISLSIWLVGGQVPHGDTGSLVWVRLSYLGLALVPANFLCLALALRERSTLSLNWQLLLYVPGVLLGLTSDMNFANARPTAHSLAIGFYNVNLYDEYAFAAMTVAYLGLAIVIATVEARRDESKLWVLGNVLLPLVAGVMAVLAVSYIRRERVPMVAFWAMAMSQYAMFLMLRTRMVPLGNALGRRSVMVFSAVVLIAGALMLVGLSRALGAQIISQELGFVIVVSILSLFVIYAALLPRIEEFVRRLREKDHLE